MTQPLLVPRKLKPLLIKIFGALPILQDPDTSQVSPSILKTEEAACNPVMSPGFRSAFWRPPLPPPQVQVRLPLPPYFGHCMPRWCMPRPMVSPFPCGESPCFLDSSSDSSLGDSQDPDLDSLTPVQSPLPVPGASGPGLSNSFIVSQTTVEIHSPSGPSVDSPT